MTQEHPITPPDKMVRGWLDNDDFPFVTGTNELLSITKDRLCSVATQAARWGADQELEACCEWLQDPDLNVDTYKLRACRRPKPPNKKQRGITALEATSLKKDDPLLYQEILNAIKELPDD